MGGRDALKYAIEHADGWVVRNLRMQYNSVFPSELIECERDRVLGEKLLTRIMNRPITIKKTEFGYICEG